MGHLKVMKSFFKNDNLYSANFIYECISKSSFHQLLENVRADIIKYSFCTSFGINFVNPVGEDDPSTSSHWQFTHFGRE